MSEFETLETEAKTELGKIDIYCKLEYQKVMAILRAHFGGDHPVITDVKKLAGENVTPEPIAAPGAHFSRDITSPQVSSDSLAGASSGIDTVVS